MPPLMPIKPLGAATFLSHGLKLPTSATWKQPSGDPHAGQYRDSLKPSQRIGVPSLIPPWFMPQNSNKLFQGACDDVGGAFKEVHDTMIDAVKFAHNLWRLEASITGLNIMGPVAVGPPGCLKGSKLEPKIKTFPGCAAWMGNKAKWRDAIA